MGKHSKYRNSWISENLDRINLTVPKGRKSELTKYALAGDIIENLQSALDSFNELMATLKK